LRWLPPLADVTNEVDASGQAIATKAGLKGFSAARVFPERHLLADRKGRRGVPALLGLMVVQYFSGYSDE
jgi:hypothetical protein